MDVTVPLDFESVLQHYGAATLEMLQAQQAVKRGALDKEDGMLMTENRDWRRRCWTRSCKGQKWQMWEEGVT